MVAIDVMYDTYLKRFCGQTRAEPHLKCEFGKHVHRVFPHIKIRRKGPLGAQISHYAGIQEVPTPIPPAFSATDDDTSIRTPTTSSRVEPTAVPIKAEKKRKSTQDSKAQANSSDRSECHLYPVAAQPHTFEDWTEEPPRKRKRSSYFPLPSASKTTTVTTRSKNDKGSGVSSPSSGNVLLFQSEASVVKKFKLPKYFYHWPCHLPEPPCPQDEGPDHPYGFFLKSLPCALSSRDGAIVSHVVHTTTVHCPDDQDDQPLEGAPTLSFF